MGARQKPISSETLHPGEGLAFLAARGLESSRGHGVAQEGWGRFKASAVLGIDTVSPTSMPPGTRYLEAETENDTEQTLNNKLQVRHVPGQETQMKDLSE